MMDWVGLAPFLGLDNVVVALALAPWCQTSGRFWLLSAWFVGVEAAAPACGALLRGILPIAQLTAERTQVMQSALLITLGFAVVGTLLARSAGRILPFPGPLPSRLLRDGRSIAALALLLGVDNLVAGTGLSLPSAYLGGLASAAPVLLACLLGRSARSRVPARVYDPASALLLLAVGAIGLL
jgi:hypothetical protein